MRIIDIIANRIRVRQAYKKIFNTPEGEIVLEHLIRASGILDPKISMNPQYLLIKEGQRRIVMSILREVGRDVPEIKEQIKESVLNEPVEEQTDG